MSSPPQMPAFNSSTVYHSPFTYSEPFPATHDESRSRSHSGSRPSPENRSRAGTYRKAVPITHGLAPSSDYAAQFPSFDDGVHHHENGDLGSNGIEMNELSRIVIRHSSSRVRVPHTRQPWNFPAQPVSLGDPQIHQPANQYKSLRRSPSSMTPMTRSIPSIPKPVSFPTKKTLRGSCGIF